MAIEATLPTFDFEPMFFILDTKCKWVMVVEKEDKYSYKGVYLAYQGKQHGFQQWPAYQNKNTLLEYAPSYDFTKNKDEAIRWAYDNSRLPDTNNVPRERMEGFPEY
jgi:hypothetical protein